jgi:hypothetical protein
MLTTSLNLSQRLAKLGVDAPSEWYWFLDGCKAHEAIGPTYYLATEKENDCDVLLCRAYTTDELLELLPEQGVEIYRRAFGGWYVRCRKTQKLFEDISISESCGLMLEYLKENNLL